MSWTTTQQSSTPQGAPLSLVASPSHAPAKSGSVVAPATGSPCSSPKDGGLSGLFLLLDRHARLAVLRHRAFRRLRIPGSPNFRLRADRFVRFNSEVARLERRIALLRYQEALR